MAGRLHCPGSHQPKSLTPAPPVVVTTATSGYGVQALGGAWDDRLAKYPAFKAVDNPSAVARYHALNPNGLAIHRHYDADDAMKYIAESGGAQPAVTRWLNETSASVNALPFALHEGFNESGYDPMVVAFETERVKMLAAQGRCACVLNLSSATYNDDALWRRDDIRQLAALVEKYNGAIGLHCYGQAILSSNVGDYYWKEDGNWSKPNVDPLPTVFDTSQCWLALRIMRVREVLAAQDLHPLLIATELGIDDCTDGDSANGVYKALNTPTRGWHDAIPIWGKMGWLTNTTSAAFYLRQIDWFCKIAHVPGLIYALNDVTEGFNGKPGTYDIQGLL